MFIANDSTGGTETVLVIYSWFTDSTVFTVYATDLNSMTDIDGNIYQIVKIGNQWWMAANLKVTHYRNGDIIPNVADNIEWKNLKTKSKVKYS